VPLAVEPDTRKGPRASIPFDIDYTGDLRLRRHGLLIRVLAPGGMITIHERHMMSLPFAAFSDPQTGRMRIRLVNTESNSYRA
jgi:6-phosphofructokinase 1